ncbi:MAG: FAD-dependent oxidoreductase, partial [Gemmatimonadota bacterium]
MTSTRAWSAGPRCRRRRLPPSPARPGVPVRAPRPKRRRGRGMAAATVVGGGLAGCEAAWQLAERGHQVALLEMRPVRTTPAHQTDGLGELVCTNSFKSEDTGNA